MDEKRLDWSTSYVVPASLRFRLTPAGTLRAEAERAPHVMTELADVAADQVELLLGFASPLVAEAAFARTAETWDLDRETYGSLLETWIARGLLRPAGAGAYATTRLALFADAVAEKAATASPVFPLRSHFAMQQPVLFVPGLGTREIHDGRRFPWVAVLEAAFPLIQAEFIALLASSDFLRVNPDFTHQGEWAAAYLWAHGERIDATCRQCPETTRLLTSIPGVLQFGLAMFSALAPHTRIAPHHGVTNAILRCQLPLRVPPGCKLKVGDHELEQQEGRCIVFDDSFLHSAWNDSDQARFVLLFDFFHPDLTGDEIEYLARLPAKQAMAKHHLAQAVDGPKAAWAKQGPAGNPPG